MRRLVFTSLILLCFTASLNLKAGVTVDEQVFEISQSIAALCTFTSGKMSLDAAACDRLTQALTFLRTPKPCEVDPYGLLEIKDPQALVSALAAGVQTLEHVNVMGILRLVTTVERQREKWLSACRAGTNKKHQVPLQPSLQGEVQFTPDCRHLFVSFGTITGSGSFRKFEGVYECTQWKMLALGTKRTDSDLSPTALAKAQATSENEIAVLKTIQKLPQEQRALFPTTLYVDPDTLLQEFYPTNWTRYSKEKSFNEVHTLNTLARISEATHVLHSLGCIHGDIKPDNILLGPTSDTSQGFLSDFGEVFCPEQLIANGKDRPLTGELDYRPPERKKGWIGKTKEEITQNAGKGDVYSIAVTAVKVLSGGIPWESCYKKEDPSGYEPCREKAEIAFREKLKSSTPFAQFIAQALDPDPTLRPTAQEFQKKMEEFRRNPWGIWQKTLTATPHASETGSSDHPYDE